MKNKIVAILACVAASVFAFAENEAPVNNCPNPQAQQMRQAFRAQHMQRMMLLLSDEELDALAKQVAEVRAMSAEERMAALKKLPNPQRGPKPQAGKAPRQGKKFMNNRGARGPQGPKGPQGPRAPRYPDCPYAQQNGNQAK